MKTMIVIITDQSNLWHYVYLFTGNDGAKAMEDAWKELKKELTVSDNEKNRFLFEWSTLPLLTKKPVLATRLCYPSRQQ